MANQPKQLSLLQLMEVVIPSIWRCEPCGYTDHEEKFTSSDGHRCPKCPAAGGNNEDVFPTRWFRCNHCGHQDEQTAFFGNELTMDEHPIHDWQAQAICPNRDCETDPEWPDNVHVIVTEIPVPGFAPVPTSLANEATNAAASP